MQENEIRRAKIRSAEGIHEECGVFGVYAGPAGHASDVASTVYYGLFALQHRGQESCGIVVNDDGIFRSYKDVGIVNDVFTPRVLSELGLGNIAVGHVRYGTTGVSERSNAQPIVVNHIKGRMALAHNGNLVNSAELRRELELSGSIFHTTSDTEAISYIITRERISSSSIEEAVSLAMEKIEGAYSLVIMSPQKLIAARDSFGFRPLCYGVREDGAYVVASESCALESVGAKYVREIEPGEILVFSPEGVFSRREHCGKHPRKLCVFELIYFSRPDSLIDGKTVHTARLRAGQLLAASAPVEADVVIGVPDSGLDAALGYSLASGIPYGIGFIKNKYIGRTFISPGQQAREDKVKIKLNPVSDTVKGKRVIMIDDSIVRGTTTARVVRMLREAGAKEIHVRISAPPFMNPCYYGTDIDSRDTLIACHHTIPEIAGIVGADSLAYLRLEDVTKLTGCPEKGKGFCTACFSGDYPTAVPKNGQKNRFEEKISKKREQN